MAQEKTNMQFQRQREYATNYYPANEVARAKFPLRVLSFGWAQQKLPHCLSLNMKPPMAADQLNSNKTYLAYGLCAVLNGTLEARLVFEPTPVLEPKAGTTANRTWVV